jgi:cell fate regulator YaaT (PSP1 superfamily)
MVASTAEYLVSHGKTGVLGRFISASTERFARGDRVVLLSERGLGLGVVLREASAEQMRVLGSAASGKLVRRAGPHDYAAQRDLLAREQQIFDAARAAAAELSLPMEVLDSELSLDGRRVILQYLLAGTCDSAGLVQRLAAQFETEVWLENLALPVHEEHHGGCGEPDCGRIDGGSGCTTCGSGCSSCGSGKVDLRPYFAHLRDKMDEQRMPLPRIYAD